MRSALLRPVRGPGGRCSRLALAGALALAACGDDDAGGSGGSSTTDASSSSGGDTTTTTGATTESSSSDAGSASADSSSGTTGPVEVVISGQVQDLPLFTPIADAMISVIDMPGFETVSAADGAYTLAPLPADTEVFIQIEPSADHFGSIIGLQTPDADDDSTDLAQVSTMTVETQVEILQPMMPAEADLSLAIIVVRLLQPTATGATIDMDPPPVPGTSYSVGADNMPVLDGNSFESGLLPFVVYFNLGDTQPGDITFTGMHPERECNIVHPAFPTLGGYVTLVDLDCPPV